MLMENNFSCLILKFFFYVICNKMLGSLQYHSVETIPNCIWEGCPLGKDFLLYARHLGAITGICRRPRTILEAKVSDSDPSTNANESKIKLHKFV